MLAAQAGERVCSGWGITLLMRPAVCFNMLLILLYQTLNQGGEMLDVSEYSFVDFGFYYMQAQA
jgi:hypothetical protein